MKLGLISKMGRNVPLGYRSWAKITSEYSMDKVYFMDYSIFSLYVPHFAATVGVLDFFGGA